jgi:hypothetical protein
MYELIIDGEVCNVECTNVNWNPEYQPFGRAGIDFVEGGKVTKTPLYTTPPAQEFVCSTGLCHYKAQRQLVVFPTMLRKMWSGGEVQAWLDENVNKENI